MVYLYWPTNNFKALVINRIRNQITIPPYFPINSSMHQKVEKVSEKKGLSLHRKRPMYSHDRPILLKT